MSNQVKIQPIHFATSLGIVSVSFIVSFAIYTSFVANLHKGYFTKFLEVDVVCNVLSDYGDSKFYDCDNHLNLDANGAEKTALAGARSILTPKEILTLLAAAKVEDARDYANSEDILMLEKSGVGSWIATAIATETNKNESQTIMQSMLGGMRLSLEEDPSMRCQMLPTYSVSSGGEEVGKVGTVFTIAMLISAISQKDTSNENDCYKNIHDSEYLAATQLASRITGYKLPNNGLKVKVKGKDDTIALMPYTYSQTGMGNILGVWDYRPSITLSEDKLDSASSIKSAMNHSWKFYDNSKYETDIGLKEKTSKMNLELKKLTYDTSGDEEKIRVNNTYYRFEVGKPILAKETQWYQEDPTQLRDGLSKLIGFLLTEINSDSDVKRARFVYQAMKGWIQFLIFFCAFTILLFLLWRGVSAIHASTVRLDSKYSYLKPQFVLGDALSETTEYSQSKSFVDHSIGLLPYMGLFGTVIGILMGLPNAAAAITATGPSANESINELFVQLGLAFSTTGIAVISVIFLESIWVAVQHAEANALRTIKAKLHSRKATKDHAVPEATIDAQAKAIGKAVAHAIQKRK